MKAKKQAHVLRQILLITGLFFLFLFLPETKNIQAVTATPAAYGLLEGDVISSFSIDGDPDVFIINDHGYKRLFLNPAIFGFYGHLGFSKVKTVAPSVKNAFITSGLFRNCEANDTKVYAIEIIGEDGGALHHLNISGTAAIAEDSDFNNKIFCINNDEDRWYTKASAFTSLVQVPKYARENTNPEPAPTPTPIVTKSLKDISFDRYNNKDILLLIDSATYDSLKNEIDRYKQDVKIDIGANIIVNANVWTSAQQVRNIIKQHYKNGKLLGSMLVGQIPLVRMETATTGSFYPNGLLSDLYYQDMDKDYTDSNNNGFFEAESQTYENKMDVWSSRLLPPGQEQGRIALLKNYFNKNHLYRQGSLKYNGVLSFESVAINDFNYSRENYYSDFSNLGSRMNLSDTSTLIYSSDILSQKQSYLQEITKPYRFALINVHGTPTQQWLGQVSSTSENVTITKESLTSSKPNAFYNILISCSNGDFSNENYIAGSYLFNGNSLAVEATTEVIFAQSTPLWFDNYKTLSLGIITGESFANKLNNGSGMTGTLFGDPTLRLNDINYSQNAFPSIQLSNKTIDFGAITDTVEKKSAIKISNAGNSISKIERISWEMSLNGSAYPGDYSFPFSFQIGNNNGGYISAIEPGKSIDLDIVFTPEYAKLKGVYKGRFNFMTNDPVNPYIHLEFSADVK